MKINMRTRNHLIILVICLMQSFNSYGQTEVDSSRVFRILTYNILHGATMNNDFDLDRIAGVIASTNPDIVALQEVDFNTKRARKMDLVTELALRTKLAPLFGRAMPYDGGEYGEGILSRYSFLSTKTHPLRYLKHPDYLFGGGCTEQFATRVSVIEDARNAPEDSDVVRG